MTGYCVMGLHADCPDAAHDNYQCDCPCHINLMMEDGPDERVY